MPRIRATFAVVAFAGMAAIAMTAAGPAGAKGVHSTATLTILPAQVRLVPGESVTVRLTTNVTTGYRWSYRVTGDRHAVTVVQHAPRPAAPDALIGAPTTTDWVVTATSDGTAVVRFASTPPGGGTQTRLGALTVIVRR
jgi:predicted secreted protein